MAISEDQLINVVDYCRIIDLEQSKLYNSLNVCLKNMYGGSDEHFGIWIYPKEVFIQTTKFWMKIYSDNGKISKDYLANTYECFAAEAGLIPSIKDQIKWGQFELPSNIEYDKQMLEYILLKMLESNFRNTMCVKRHNNYGITSRITFKGSWANVKIIEELLVNQSVKQTWDITLGKANAAKYVINRGYYIFGEKNTIDSLLTNIIQNGLTKESILEQYTQYCIPVLDHMKDVIKLNSQLKNEVVDILCQGFINPNKLSTDILYTNIKNNTNSKTIMSDMLKNQNKTLSKKSYWAIVS